MPSLKCRLKKLKYQDLLSEKDLSRIYTDNDIVEELEKIRAEIEDMDWDIYKTERKVPKEYVEKERIYEILNKEISKLKGENN